MAFDEAGYRKYAAQNKFDPDEVEKEIAYQKQSSGDFKKDQQGFTLSSPEKLNQDLGNDWWHLPAAMAVGGLGFKALQSGLDLFKGQGPVAPPAIEPTFDSGIAPPQTTSPSLDDQIKMERLKQAQMKTAQLEQATQPKPAGTPVPAADSVAAVAPESVPKPAPTIVDLEAKAVEVKNALAAQKASQGAPTEAALIKAMPTPSVAPEVPVEGAIAPKTRAPKTQKTFKSVADIPEGMKFSSEVGGADSWLHDAVGPEARKFILEEFNQGKRLGGGQAAMTKAYGLVGQYEDWLKKNVPENILGRAERKAAGVPHPEQAGPLGKAAKVGGVAGLLMTAAQFANAKTPVEKMNAGANMLGAVLPPGADILEAGAPGVSGSRFEEAYKLGSPYAQTEEAKKFRLKEKAGAGRGIAPPSAYMR